MQEGVCMNAALCVVTTEFGHGVFLLAIQLVICLRGLLHL